MSHLEAREYCLVSHLAAHEYCLVSHLEAHDYCLVPHLAANECWLVQCTNALFNPDLVVASSFSQSTSRSSRVISTVPLSLTVLTVDGISIRPVCSCCLSMFIPASPPISFCKLLRGNSKARQQDNDHFGFLCHSFLYKIYKKIYKYMPDITLKQVTNSFKLKLSWPS